MRRCGNGLTNSPPGSIGTTRTLLGPDRGECCAHCHEPTPKMLSFRRRGAAPVTVLGHYTLQGRGAEDAEQRTRSRTRAIRLPPTANWLSGNPSAGYCHCVRRCVRRAFLMRQRLAQRPGLRTSQGLSGRLAVNETSQRDKRCASAGTKTGPDTRARARIPGGASLSRRGY